MSPDPAQFPWHEVKKVDHYCLSVGALTQPMQVKEDPGTLTLVASVAFQSFENCLRGKPLVDKKRQSRYFERKSLSLPRLVQE